MKLLLIGSLLCASAVADTPDQPRLPKELQGIGIVQRLNAQAPMDAQFKDESGKIVRLGDYFGRRPAILALVYYRCTMLCSYILNGVVSGLRPLALKPGQDFDVVAISIDPAEDSELAAGKRDHYAKSYSSKAGTQGWHFLTGNETNIRAVADAVGFHYRYDAKTKLFLHASGVMVLTPEGRVARYFYGVEYTPKDLKLGLIEASANRIGSPADQILLFCYHYDPATGKYGAAVVNLLRIAAAAALLALVITLFILWRRDIRTARALRPEGRVS
ncbi:MAG: SCO family protein [Bryobacteraceae bacterium]